MQRRPFNHQTANSRRQPPFHYGQVINTHRCLVIPIPHMEVRRAMLIPEHANHNSEKPTDLRHETPSCSLPIHVVFARHGAILLGRVGTLNPSFAVGNLLDASAIYGLGASLRRAVHLPAVAAHQRCGHVYSRRRLRVPSPPGRVHARPTIRFRPVGQRPASNASRSDAGWCTLAGVRIPLPAFLISRLVTSATVAIRQLHAYHSPR